MRGWVPIGGDRDPAPDADLQTAQYFKPDYGWGPAAPVLKHTHYRELAGWLSEMAGRCRLAKSAERIARPRTEIRISGRSPQPTRSRGHCPGEGERMLINEAVIERRAKELCKQDGFEWDVELKMPVPDPTKITLRPILKEQDRQKYLARAHSELSKECGDRASRESSQSGQETHFQFQA
jgi:hypothetical protein